MSDGMHFEFDGALEDESLAYEAAIGSRIIVFRIRTQRSRRREAERVAFVHFSI